MMMIRRRWKRRRTYTKQRIIKYTNDNDNNVNNEKKRK